MAKAETEGGKRGRKAAMKAERQTESSTAVLEPPEPPPVRAKGRQRAAPPKAVTFFERLDAIILADWGTRAKVTVYRLEPITNNLLGSDKKYIKVYNQPPVTEERIKQDCGSGRYRLYLTYKAAAENEREVDSVEFDILDTAFPPKVPKGAWVDDPRNAQWAWAKEYYERQTPGVAGGVVPAQASVLETIDGILDVSERLRPPVAPAKSPTEELSTVVTVAKDLAALQRPPDKSGMETFLFQELAAQRAQTDKLLMMLLENKQKPADGGVSVIKEVVGGLKELVPTVKEFFPEGIGNGGGGGSRLNGWQEFAVALGNSPVVGNIVSPLAAAFASALVGRFTGGARPGQPPAPPPAYQPPAPHQPPSQPAALPGAELIPFLAMIAPPMCNYIRTMAIPGNEPEAMGKDFAGWVFDGYGGDPRYMEAIQAARMMGPAGIITAFQSVPLWKDKGPNGMMVSLEELQAKLPAFFTAFLNYDPNAEDETEEDEDEETGPPEVVTYREANA